LAIVELREAEKVDMIDLGFLFLAFLFFAITLTTLELYEKLMGK
jgi:hypothetical protein